MYCISVIIANYNSGNLLRDTLNSLSKCNLKNDCITIVDNNSEDGSFELSKIILKKFKNDKFFIQDEDKGVYDALNKGIKYKDAQYILILHAGDQIIPKSYNLVKKIIKNFVDKNQSKIIIFSKGILKNKKGIKIYDTEVKTIRFRMSLFHSNVLIPKYLYEKYGYFDYRFKITGDFYFLRKILTSGEQYITLNLSLISFDEPGLSGQISSLKKIYRENFIIMRESNVSNKDIVRFIIYLIKISISIIKKKFLK